MTEPTTPAAAPVTDRMAAARAARAAKQAAKAAPEPTTPAAAPVTDADAPEAPEPTILEKVAVNEEQKRQQKIDALRKAKAGHNTDVGEKKVKVRVLKLGHGLISMGDHAGGLGDLTYDYEETPTLPQSIAEALEKKGFVEIQ